MPKPKYIAEANGKRVVLYYTNEFGEYMVRFYEWSTNSESWRELEDATYFTSDWVDALGTANNYLGLPKPK